MDIIAPLGHPEPGFSSVLLFQKLGKQVAVLNGKRQQHPSRCKATAEIILLHQAGNRRFFLVRHRKYFIILVQQVPTAEMEHGKAGLGLRLGIPDHIRIRQRTGCHKLLLPQRFHRIQPVTEAGRQFKFQTLRRVQHLRADTGCDRFVIPHEKLPRLLNQRPVFNGAFPRLTPAGTLVHVVIQAGTVFPDIPGKFLFTAGQFQRQANGLHDVLRYAPAAKGAVVPRAVIRDFADHSDSGVYLPHIQPEIRIPFVILEQNVVFGTVALNQGAFQYQRLKLRRGYYHVEMVDVADHQLCFGRMGGGILKILAHPVFQFFGLADIDHLVVTVAHDIHAGRVRQAQRLFFQFIKGHAVLQK